MADQTKWADVANSLREHLFAAWHSINSLPELRAFLLDKALPESADIFACKNIHEIIVALSDVFGDKLVDVYDYIFNGPGSSHTYPKWTRDSTLELVDDFVAYLVVCAQSVGEAIAAYKAEPRIPIEGYYDDWYEIRGDAKLEMADL